MMEEFYKLDKFIELKSQICLPCNKIKNNKKEKKSAYLCILNLCPK